MSNPQTVALTIEGDSVHATGADLLKSRRARLFFRSVLGGTATEDGWQCPPHRMPAQQLVIHVHDWLDRHGYVVKRTGQADQVLDRELERRRSFQRTRAAASSFKEGGPPAEFPAVQASLEQFGWSDRRRLRPHQMAGLAHAMAAVNAANFSVPGAGKTVTTLAAAVAHMTSDTIDLVVVVGPLACFSPWEQEVRAAVGTAIRTVRVRGNARQRSLLYQQTDARQLLLLSYATAANDARQLAEIFDMYRVMLVVDESHRIKRFRGGVWAPALVDLARGARVRTVLSGTPMPQTGRDLYTQLNILWPDGQLTGTRDAFAARVDRNFASVLRDVHPFMSRAPKSALGLTPYRIHRHEVELVGTQCEIYELIENQFRRRLADADNWQDRIEALRRGRPIRLLQAASNPDVFNQPDNYYSLPALGERSPTLMERLAGYRQLEAPAKSLAAIELLRDIVDQGGKAVCWSNFVPNLDQFSALVRAELGIPVYQIDGRVPAGTDAMHFIREDEEPGDVDTREQIIHRFLTQTGPSVLVTNPASCSESISLHRSCHNAIYLDRTYDCALWLQSIDRIHRLGLPPGVDVNIHVLAATVDGRETIDHLVEASLADKEERMRQLLEGADLAPLHLSVDASVDADGDETDLAALLRFLLGEEG